ncbi:MAG TPA: MBL fold metallo-hydrolase [Candidatus Polarisedimenticolia bacterium]|nr:MBL fold metallo-hydrolase [Candidatus Polarisedimenticolia bacterium]
MATTPSADFWTSRDLLGRLERRERFFVLDVRNRDEFERFQIEGREPLPSINVPYFEMLELGGKDEMEDSLIAYAERDLRSQLPTDRAVLAVCAKGETSEHVARGLRRLGYACVSLQGGMKSWADHCAIRAVVETADLAIYQVARPARGCLSYVIANEGRALVIDPLRRLDPYLDLAKAKDFIIDGVLDTHSHADHISGGPALAAAAGAPYHLHPYDAIHPMDLLPVTISYEPLRDGQALRAGRRTLTVMHIPGHTLGLVAFRLDDEYLFAGDSIFIRSIARPDLGGKAEAWAPLHGRSLRRLLALPDRTVVLPGHFSGLDEADEGGLFAAPLGGLKRRNDGLLALQKESEDGFVRYLMESLPKFIPEYVDIKRVNTGLLSPDEDQASTLELGKNVCALSQAYGEPGGGGR